MKKLAKPCPLCKKQHTEKQQIACYIELQSKIEVGAATAEEKQAFQPMPMSMLMNEYRL